MVTILLVSFKWSQTGHENGKYCEEGKIADSFFESICQRLFLFKTFKSKKYNFKENDGRKLSLASLSFYWTT